ncbi:hypothetical protein [Pedococcus sp. P5_B7]
MNHFLIVFERLQGQLLDIREFDRADKALSGRFEAERLYHGSRDVEVVVLGAKSLEDLRRTHSRYFSTGRELVRGAVGRVAEASEPSHY